MDVGNTFNVKGCHVYSLLQIEIVLNNSDLIGFTSSEADEQHITQSDLKNNHKNHILYFKAN